MSFKAYKHRFDEDRIEYAFEGEEYRLTDDLTIEGDCQYRFEWDEIWEKLPPNPSVILATTSYMAGVPYLDSLKTMYELDRILNIEAEQAREDKAYQELVLKL